MSDKPEFPLRVKNLELRVLLALASIELHRMIRDFGTRMNENALYRVENLLAEIEAYQANKEI